MDQVARRRRIWPWQSSLLFDEPDSASAPESIFYAIDLIGE
jgi:hypothetical protein